MKLSYKCIVCNTEKSLDSIIPLAIGDRIYFFCSKKCRDILLKARSLKIVTSKEKPKYNGTHFGTRVNESIFEK